MLNGTVGDQPWRREVCGSPKNPLLPGLTFTISDLDAAVADAGSLMPNNASGRPDLWNAEQCHRRMSSDAMAENGF